MGRAGALQRLQARWEEASRNEGGLVVCTGEPGHRQDATRGAIRGRGPRRRSRRALRPQRRGERHAVPAVRRGAAALRRELPDPERRDAAARGRSGGAGKPRTGARSARRARQQAAPERARTATASALRGGGQAPAACRATGIACCSCSRICIGPTSPRCCCCARSLRRGTGSPLLVIATYSDADADASGPMARLLADLRREGVLDQIRLGGLRRSEAAELVSLRVGRDSLDGAAVKRLCGQTGGNPFFIEELLRASTEDATAGVPPGVKDVIGRRLDRLARRDARHAHAGGRAGKRLPAHHARGGGDGSGPGRAHHLARGGRARRAWSSRIPRRSTASRSRHSLVRETLYERPIASRRLRLHRRVAEALEAAPLRGASRPSSRITTSRRGRSAGRRRRSCTRLKAAEACQTAHAYEDAAAHYERALTALEIVRRDDAAARCDVLLALGAARWQASEPDPRSTFHAGGRARSRARLVRAARAGGARRRRALLCAGRDRSRRTSTCSRRPSTALEPGDSVLRVRLLARLAENLVFAPPPERAAARAAEAVGMARRLGEPTRWPPR